MLLAVLKVVGFIFLSGLCIFFWLIVVCILAASMLSSRISQMEERRSFLKEARDPKEEA